MDPSLYRWLRVVLVGFGSPLSPRLDCHRAEVLDIENGTRALIRLQELGFDFHPDADLVRIDFPKIVHQPAVGAFQLDIGQNRRQFERFLV